MLKKTFLLGILCALTIHFAHAQKSELLSTKDEKRIAKAEKKISKAEAIAAKADPLTEKVETAKADGKSRRKIKRLEKKANSKTILSASYYKEGYNKKYSAYEKAVKRNLKEGNVADNKDQLKKAKDAYKKGKKWRRQLANEDKLEESVELLFMANNIQEDATKHLNKILIPIPQEATIVETPIAIDSIPATIEADTLVMAEDTAAISEIIEPIVTEENTVAAAIVAPIAIIEDTEEVKPNENGIYFTVQISASPTQLNQLQKDNLYSGSLKILEHKTESSYKYSVGKFNTYDEASALIGNEIKKGFVVAYKGDERISVRLAKEQTQP
ncbi:hypothetical protein [Saccharicrinis aurantiacus]|uniref:hypothetical protein n=1 Tax=Saccharicrinis aurantiacus TaxID=1849719 RepID=UPI000838777C|nr:hypothetical protein [Saccharicrinis aurantiacus]